MLRQMVLNDMKTPHNDFASMSNPDSIANVSVRERQAPRLDQRLLFASACNLFLLSSFSCLSLFSKASSLASSSLAFWSATFSSSSISNAPASILDEPSEPYPTSSSISSSSISSSSSVPRYSSYLLDLLPSLPRDLALAGGL